MPPFIGKSQDEILTKHLKEKPKNLSEARPDGIPELAKLVMSMLEKSTDRRIQDMNLVLYEIAKIRRTAKVPSQTTRVFGRSTRLNIQAGMAQFFRVERQQRKGTSINGRGVITNISRSGIGFKCNMKLTPDETLELLVHIPPLKQPLKFVGNVAWCNKPQNDTIYSTGVRLVEVPPDYLAKFEMLKEALDSRT